MPMTTAEFVARVTASGPDLREVVDEHRRDYGEVLIHVLCGDLSRHCVAAWKGGGSASELSSCLVAVATALEDGDDSLKNAIQASFVENTGPFDPLIQPFIETWPESLRAEAERKRKAR
jgi:hypothetical protein